MKHFVLAISVVLFSQISVAACPAGQRAFVVTAEDGYTITSGCTKYFGPEKGWLKEGLIVTKTDAQQILHTDTKGTFDAHSILKASISGGFSSSFSGISFIIQRGSTSGGFSGNVNGTIDTKGNFQSQSTTSPTYTVGAVVEASYHEDKLSGVTRTYTTNIYQQRSLLEERSYKAGQLNGRYIAYNDMQIPITEGSFLDDQKNGYWKYSNPKGIVINQGSYDKDKKTGIWKSSEMRELPNGQSYSDMKFFQLGYQNDQPHGIYVVYGPKHKIVEGFYKDGLKSGLWKTYNDQGVVTSKGNYEIGALQGPWEYYDDQGKIVTQGEYYLGKKTGKWFSKDAGELPDAALDSISYSSFEVNYINDTLSGSFTMYGADKNKLVSGTYENGSHDGIWKFYNPLSEEVRKKLYFDVNSIISRSKAHVRLNKFSTQYNGRTWVDATASINIMDRNNANTVVSGKYNIEVDENDDYSPTLNQAPWVELKIVDSKVAFDMSITEGAYNLQYVSVDFPIRGAIDENDASKIMLANALPRGYSDYANEKEVKENSKCKDIVFTGTTIEYRAYEPYEDDNDKYFCKGREVADVVEYAVFDIMFTVPEGINK